MPPDVSVRDLVKHYVVPERAGGLRASLRSVVRRRHRLVRAVDGISFEVDRGEVVGFLGPNGAGKTTALKVMSGLLHPTDGQVDVLGFTPWDRRAEYLSQITLIMGQRQQLPPRRRLTQHPVYPDSSQRRVYPRPDAQWRVTPSPPGEAHGHKIAARPTHCEVMGRPRTQRCVPRLLAWTTRRAPYRVFDSRSVGRSASPSSYG